VAWWGGFREGKGEEAARVGGGALKGEGRRRGKAGEAGRRRGSATGATMGERGGRLEVEGDPDGWAPLVSERVREKDRWAKWILMGRGRNGPSAGKRKRKGGGMGCWAGWWEWVR
jgi:hypothetical protein